MFLTKDPKDQTFSGCLHLMCAVGCLVLGLCGSGFVHFVPVWVSMVSGRVECLVTGWHAVFGAKSTVCLDNINHDLSHGK